MPTNESGHPSCSGIRKRKLTHNLQAYVFMLPNLLLFLSCSVYPIIWTLRFVFFQYGGYGMAAPMYVGMNNLARVFRDSVYWRAVGNTFVYGFGKVLIILPIAFILALLLNKQKRANALMQSIVFLPTIMSSAVMGLVFYLLFNAYNGEINALLLKLGFIGRPINWLGKQYAMRTLIMTAVWGGLGNYMVYFIAGLQRISYDALESARVDGANAVQTIWYITLPMLGPILKIILMLSITTAFHDISNVMVLTEGGPTNTTMVMALYGYQYFFPVSAASSMTPQYGYGAAVSVVSAVITGIVTLAYLAISKKLDEVY